MWIDIYTDGGCSGNPGPGGWAYAIYANSEAEEGSGAGKFIAENWGAESHTTNNRMELEAVIAALDALQNFAFKPEKLNVYTDSQYVQKGISIWVNDWKKRGWKTLDKKPVKNQDLWQRLDSIASFYKNEAMIPVNWIWVKGHAGNEYNERCDELTQIAIASVQLS